MSTETINYGIHLGTTEAMIAHCIGSEIEVFRNAEGFESTPCAVWMDKQGRMFVGRVAKERHFVFEDYDNAFIEFQRNMGTASEYMFARNGLKIKPEELSAEVLKSLRADVQRRTGELVCAAVITVPADFDVPACEATKRAASLAGLQHSLLLQEPVAVAEAYGFSCQKDNTSWLIYDFQSGTFDAEILQVRDGLIQVIGHAGDNHLGEKNFDWAIVEQLFIPALTKERALTDFGRSNPKWRGAISKLRIQAEAAKMRLSSSQSTEVLIDFLCKDDRGDPVEFNYELSRSEWQRLAAPFIDRTINICKAMLAARRLAPPDIAKIILVGNPTLMPIFREQLKDPRAGLGIPLEFTVDPLTVVARGAAVFAGEQRKPDTIGRRESIQAAQLAVKLDCTHVAPDTKAEDANKWSVMLAGAKQLLIAAKSFFDESQGVSPAIKADFALLQREAREAMEGCVPDLLSRRLQVILTLTSSIGTHRLILAPHQAISDGVTELRGEILGPLGLLPEGFSIELVNEDIRPEWNSGWLLLDQSGVFSVSAKVNRGRASSEFRVALRDGTTKPMKLIPNYFVLSNSNAAKADLRKETVSKP
ncbi:MAG: Hsp70 family protein [Verrucomicrobiota bacterium]|jgi:hypothetical protein